MEYNGEERRKDSTTRRFHDMELRLKTLEDKVDQNIQMTTGVFEIVGHARSFFSVLGWIGNAVKWTVGVLAAIAVLWAMITGRNPGGPS